MVRVTLRLYFDDVSGLSIAQKPALSLPLYKFSKGRLKS